MANKLMGCFMTFYLCSSVSSARRFARLEGDHRGLKLASKTKK